MRNARRLQSDSRRNPLEGVLTPLVRQCLRKLVPRFVRRNSNAVAKTRVRFPWLSAQSKVEVPTSLDEAGIDPKGLPEVLDRLVVLSAAAKDDSQIVVGLDRVGR